MRLLGASFKKTDEKLNDRGSEDEIQRRDFRVERAIRQFMPWFPMIIFLKEGALFVLYPRMGKVWPPCVRPRQSFE